MHFLALLGVAVNLLAVIYNGGFCWLSIRRGKPEWAIVHGGLAAFTFVFLADCIQKAVS